MLPFFLPHRSMLRRFVNRTDDLLHDVIHHIVDIVLISWRGSRFMRLDNAHGFAQVALCSTHKHSAQLMLAIFPHKGIRIKRAIGIVVLRFSRTNRNRRRAKIKR